MQADYFMRAIVNDLFDDDLDEEFLARLDEALDAEPAAAADRDEPAPKPPPHLC